MRELAGLESRKRVHVDVDGLGPRPSAHPRRAVIAMLAETAVLTCGSAGAARRLFVRLAATSIRLG